MYVDDDGVWRGLSEEALADYEALAGSRFFREAMARGDIVGTERVDGEWSLPGEWAAALRHERIEVLSYPYEWPFEMLRDAALLQLALTRGALADGLITKDASSYNVQFVGARPVFIDVGSFERLRGGEPWPGYRQFCELFLNPLLVQALARRAVPAAAARQRPRHLADHRRRPAAPRGPLHEGRASPTSSCTPEPSAGTPTPTASTTSRRSCNGPGSAPG